MHQKVYLERLREVSLKQREYQHIPRVLRAYLWKWLNLMCLLQSISGFGVLPFSYSLRRLLQMNRDAIKTAMRTFRTTCEEVSDTWTHRASTLWHRTPGGRGCPGSDRLCRRPRSLSLRHRPPSHPESPSSSWRLPSRCSLHTAESKVTSTGAEAGHTPGCTSFLYVTLHPRSACFCEYLTGFLTSSLQ